MRFVKITFVFMGLLYFFVFWPVPGVLPKEKNKSGFLKSIKVQFKLGENKKILGLSCRRLNIKDGDLPLELFPDIRDLNLAQTKITNKTLEKIAKLKNLRILNLSQTFITDEGIFFLKDLPYLENLDLSYTKISKNGLKSLHACKNLRFLNLEKTDLKTYDWISLMENLEGINLTGGSVMDNHCFNIKAQKKLKYLILNNNKITNLGLIHIGKLKNLRILGLAGNSQITDEGLNSLKDLTMLEGLDLFGTKISNLGMKIIGSFKNLQFLILGANKITDEGFSHVSNLEKLKSLSVSLLPISEGGLIAGIKNLKKLNALILCLVPFTGKYMEKCQFWNNLDLFDLEGTKFIGKNLLHFGKSKKLKSLGFKNCILGKEELKIINSFSNLNELFLSESEIVDEDLKNLSNLEKIKYLNLDGNPINGIGLKYLAKNQNLMNLNLDNTKFENHNLEMFKLFPKLNSIFLGGSKITDVGIRKIKNFPEIQELSLWGTGITDKGAKDLKNLKNLKYLEIGGTQISEIMGSQLEKENRFLSIQKKGMTMFPFNNPEFFPLIYLEWENWAFPLKK